MDSTTGNVVEPLNEFLQALKREADFVGTGDTSKESYHGYTEDPSFLTLALSHLKDAISLMPDEQKSDYVKASLIAPSLVQTETDPVRFLRHHQYNVFAAARSIVLYWEYRRKIFRERWLYPMTVGEAGALLPQDKEVLLSGWIALVQQPPVPAVVVFDASRFLPEAIEAKIRAVFFMCTVADHTDTQNSGISIINSLIQQPLLSYQMTLALLEMIKRAFPIKVKHIICIKAMEEDRGSLTAIYGNKIGQAIAELFGRDAGHEVYVDNLTQALEHLEALDIPKSCIPATLGGSWTYNHLNDWQQYAARTTKHAPVSSSALLGSSDTETNSSERGEELYRARNALYSRRAYQRRKAKQTDIEEQRERLEEENKRLSREYERLQGLYNAAIQLLRAWNSADPGGVKAKALKEGETGAIVERTCESTWQQSTESNPVAPVLQGAMNQQMRGFTSHHPASRRVQTNQTTAPTTTEEEKGGQRFSLSRHARNMGSADDGCERKEPRGEK